MANHIDHIECQFRGRDGKLEITPLQALAVQAKCTKEAFEWISACHADDKSGVRINFAFLCAIEDFPFKDLFKRLGMNGTQHSETRQIHMAVMYPNDMLNLMLIPMFVTGVQVAFE